MEVLLVVLKVCSDIDYRSTGPTVGTPGSFLPVVLKVETDSWYAGGGLPLGGSEGLLGFRLREGRDRQLVRLGVLLPGGSEGRDRQLVRLGAPLPGGSEGLHDPRLVGRCFRSIPGRASWITWLLPDCPLGLKLLAGKGNQG